jgi:hypothetical protein
MYRYQFYQECHCTSPAAKRQQPRLIRSAIHFCAGRRKSSIKQALLFPPISYCCHCHTCLDQPASRHFPTIPSPEHGTGTDISLSESAGRVLPDDRQPGTQGEDFRNWWRRRILKIGRKRKVSFLTRFGWLRLVVRLWLWTQS